MQIAEFRFSAHHGVVEMIREDHWKDRPPGGSKLPALGRYFHALGNLCCEGSERSGHTLDLYTETARAISLELLITAEYGNMEPCSLASFEDVFL